MDLTPLHERRLAKRRAHRLVQRLRAVEDHQQAAVRAEPTTLQIRQQALTHGAVFRRAVPHAQRVLGAVLGHADRHDEAMLADVHAVEQQPRAPRSSNGRACHVSSWARVLTTKRRLTALLLVPRLGIRPRAVPGSARTAASPRRRASARRPVDSAGRSRHRLERRQRYFAAGGRTRGR